MRVLTLDASNMKTIARKFASSRPVLNWASGFGVCSMFVVLVSGRWREGGGNEADRNDGQRATTRTAPTRGEDIILRARLPRCSSWANSCWHKHPCQNQQFHQTDLCMSGRRVVLGSGKNPKPVIPAGRGCLEEESFVFKFCFHFTWNVEMNLIAHDENQSRKLFLQNERSYKFPFKRRSRPRSVVLMRGGGAIPWTFAKALWVGLPLKSANAMKSGAFVNLQTLHRFRFLAPSGLERENENTRNWFCLVADFRWVSWWESACRVTSCWLRWCLKQSPWWRAPGQYRLQNFISQKSRNE